jgi:hypothetical protein
MLSRDVIRGVATQLLLFLTELVNICGVFYGVNGYAHNYAKYVGESVHAEMSSINKLKIKDRINKIKNIDILVIRVNTNRELTMSRPCYKCCCSLTKHPLKKGIKVNKIYYSNDKGEIVFERLNQLINSEYKHVNRYIRMKNLNK